MADVTVQVIGEQEIQAEFVIPASDVQAGVSGILPVSVHAIAVPPEMKTYFDGVRTDVEADRVEVADYAWQTAADAVSTGEDRVATGLDRDATAADRVATGGDVTTTGTNATAASDSAALSKRWAVETTTAVEGTDFGSKKYAQDSQASAGNAAASETSAAGSAAAAGTSETNAAGSASAAGASKVASGLSEGNAAASASAAASSATAASTSETNAAAEMSDHVAAVDPHTQYVRKVTGKALSTEDYTTAEKTKLGGIATGAQVNTVDSVDGLTGAVDLSVRYETRRKNNLTATTDPVVTDDSAAGYQPLSRWLNTATSEIWLCISATAGAANWQQATLTIDELGSAALANTSEFDAAGAATTAVSNHEAAVDPHTQYTTDLEATSIAVDNAITFAIALG